MRTVDSTHRWNLNTMECSACSCSTADPLALAQCAKVPPPPKGVSAPKAPDLFATSMPPAEPTAKK